MYSKLFFLKDYLKKLDSVLIAFSGGVDSSFLLKVSYEVLGNNVLAVTARSATYPQREYEEAVKFTEEYKIPHLVIVSEELDIEGFSNNSTDRCYLCKKELFSKLTEIAKEKNIKYVAEGSNYDDISDFRPGMKAAKELGVISPLKEAMLTKQEIRLLSREMGLKTWNKPSFACLSSRIPYGQVITREKLNAIDLAEEYLINLGFTQVRVRHHGDVARIELLPEEMKKLLDRDIADKIYSYFKDLGFVYTSLDIKGYRIGSMNETIK